MKNSDTAKQDAALNARLESLRGTPSEAELQAQAQRVFGSSAENFKNSPPDPKASKFDNEVDELLKSTADQIRLDKANPHLKSEPLSDKTQENQIVRNAMAGAAQEKQVEAEMKALDTQTADYHAKYPSKPTNAAAAEATAGNEASTPKVDTHYRQTENWGILKDSKSQNAASAYPDLQKPISGPQETTTASINFIGPERPQASAASASGTNKHDANSPKAKEDSTYTNIPTKQDTTLSNDSSSAKTQYFINQQASAQQVQSTEVSSPATVATTRRQAPSWMSAQQEAPAQQKDGPQKLSSATLHGARTAETIGKIGMGVGVATALSGIDAGIGVAVISALVTMAASTLKKSEHVQLAADALAKKAQGAEVSPEVLEESRSVMRNSR